MLIFLRNTAFFFTVLFFLTSTNAGDLTQEQWINSMSKNLPKTFCAKNQYYRVCYDVSEESCQATIFMSVTDCIDQIMTQLPETFSYSDIRQWGPVIEACIDKDYSTTYADFQVDSDECNALK